jgi:hypothetical protein
MRDSSHVNNSFYGPVDDEDHRRQRLKRDRVEVVADSRREQPFIRLVSAGWILRSV